MVSVCGWVVVFVCHVTRKNIWGGQHITVPYATQLHFITELHTRFLNILIPCTMKIAGPLETHERLLN